MPRRMLFIDTPEDRLKRLGEAFQVVTADHFDIQWARSDAELTERLSAGLEWDLVVLDYHLGHGQARGVELLPVIRRRYPDVPIVVVAESADVDLVAEAIRAGANDFLVRGERLVERVKTLLQKVRPHLKLIDRNRLLREQNRLLQDAAAAGRRMIGESPQMRQVWQRIERVARIPRPVLITGQRGVGKELVARALHDLAGDPGRPMVVVNCAALPDNLLESELFGHERGAFTGADATVRGKFELAGGGTLFLDEIGNMTLPFQQKILRVVEYHTFTRVGGTAEIEVNTRIIAATNADLRAKMEAGEFLRDLHDRLSFEVIHVPPLRERTGDIALLARHFLHEFMQEIPALGGKRLSQQALNVLERYPFPGNVRELKNIIERAAYRDLTNEITPEDIGMLPDVPLDGAGAGFNQKVEAFQQQLILGALDQAAGNQAQAARDLGLSYHQFRYFLRKFRPADD